VVEAAARVLVEQGKLATLLLHNRYPLPVAQNDYYKLPIPWFDKANWAHRGDIFAPQHIEYPDFTLEVQRGEECDFQRFLF
jgi:hypothetical protein